MQFSENIINRAIKNDKIDMSLSKSKSKSVTFAGNKSVVAISAKMHKKVK